ncbi:MAG: VTT domain-containing protein [Cyclobacteriaceae bacterium]
MEIKPVNEKRYFLISNLLKGIFYLILVLVVFLLLRKFSSEEQRYAWFGSIYNNLPLVMALFVSSEILFGIIPPEVFMLWSLETRLLGDYFMSIGYLSLISYAAGFLNFNFGKWVKNKDFIRKTKWPWVRKYLGLFKKYGAYLVVVGSITPLPFSAVALFCGMGNLNSKKYLWFSLLRIVRFFVYALVLWSLY